MDILSPSAHLPLHHEASRLHLRDPLVSPELLFHVLVSQSSQVERQEPVQDQNPFVERADSGHVSDARHFPQVSLTRAHLLKQRPSPRTGTRTLGARTRRELASCKCYPTTTLFTRKFTLWLLFFCHADFGRFCLPLVVGRRTTAKKAQ